MASSSGSVQVECTLVDTRNVHVGYAFANILTISGRISRDGVISFPIRSHHEAYRMYFGRLIARLLQGILNFFGLGRNGGVCQVEVLVPRDLELLMSSGWSTLGPTPRDECWSFTISSGHSSVSKLPPIASKEWLLNTRLPLERSKASSRFSSSHVPLAKWPCDVRPTADGTCSWLTSTAVRSSRTRQGSQRTSITM